MPRLDLDVFLEGCPDPVGCLTRHDDGATGFRYLTDNLPYPLSLSLPVREDPYGDSATRAFFANLLFENAQREQVMQRHGLDFSDVVGLLEHLGADCPGAISCVPVGEGPAKTPGDMTSDYDVLGEDDLNRIMTSLRDRRRVPDDTRDPSPLAGVQGKIALTRLPDGRFALPKSGLNVPTTHILKVHRPGDMVSIAQEHAVMALMGDLQRHPVALTEPIGGGDLRGLLVTRFDRRIDGATIHRLHQEDFAQALGLGPALKYERDGVEGRRFSAEAAGQILSATDRPGQARQAFLEVTLVNLLLGNTDNHAKNHALLYTGPRPALAPVYDVVPVLIDDQVTHQLAFDIGTAKMTDEITSADMDALLRALGFPRMTPAQRARLQAIVSAAVDRIDGMMGPNLKRIGDAMSKQARALAPAVGLKIDVPERDPIILNRP
jgi:serine/threonine-protein kinase HipA